MKLSCGDMIISMAQLGKPRLPEDRPQAGLCSSPGLCSFGVPPTERSHGEWGSKECSKTLPSPEP